MEITRQLQRNKSDPASNKETDSYFPYNPSSYKLNRLKLAQKENLEIPIDNVCIYGKKS